MAHADRIADSPNQITRHGIPLTILNGAGHPNARWLAAPTSAQELPAAARLPSDRPGGHLRARRSGCFSLSGTGQMERARRGLAGMPRLRGCRCPLSVRRSVALEVPRNPVRQTIHLARGYPIARAENASLEA